MIFSGNLHRQSSRQAGRQTDEQNTKPNSPLTLCICTSGLKLHISARAEVIIYGWGVKCKVGNWSNSKSSTLNNHALGFCQHHQKQCPEILPLPPRAVLLIDVYFKALCKSMVNCKGLTETIKKKSPLHILDGLMLVSRPQKAPEERQAQGSVLECPQ